MFHIYENWLQSTTIPAPVLKSLREGTYFYRSHKTDFSGRIVDSRAHFQGYKIKGAALALHNPTHRDMLTLNDILSKNQIIELNLHGPLTTASIRTLMQSMQYTQNLLLQTQTASSSQKYVLFGKALPVEIRAPSSDDMQAKTTYAKEVFDLMSMVVLGSKLHGGELSQTEKIGICPPDDLGAHYGMGALVALGVDYDAIKLDMTYVYRTNNFPRPDYLSGKGKNRKIDVHGYNSIHIRELIEALIGRENTSQPIPKHLLSERAERSKFGYRTQFDIKMIVDRMADIETIRSACVLDTIYDEDRYGEWKYFKNKTQIIYGDSFQVTVEDLQHLANRLRNLWLPLRVIFHDSALTSEQLDIIAQWIPNSAIDELLIFEANKKIENNPQINRINDLVSQNQKNLDIEIALIQKIVIPSNMTTPSPVMTPLTNHVLVSAEMSEPSSISITSAQQNANDIAEMILAGGGYGNSDSSFNPNTPATGSYVSNKRMSASEMFKQSPTIPHQQSNNYQNGDDQANYSGGYVSSRRVSARARFNQNSISIPSNAKAGPEGNLRQTYHKTGSVDFFDNHWMSSGGINETLAASSETENFSISREDFEAWQTSQVKYRRPDFDWTKTINVLTTEQRILQAKVDAQGVSGQERNALQLLMQQNQDKLEEEMEVRQISKHPKHAQYYWDFQTYFQSLFMAAFGVNSDFISVNHSQGAKAISWASKTIKAAFPRAAMLTETAAGAVNHIDAKMRKDYLKTVSVLGRTIPEAIKLSENLARLLVRAYFWQKESLSSDVIKQVKQDCKNIINGIESITITHDEGTPKQLLMLAWHHRNTPNLDPIIDAPSIGKAMMTFENASEQENKSVLKTAPVAQHQALVVSVESLSTHEVFVPNVAQRLQALETEIKKIPSANRVVNGSNQAQVMIDPHIHSSFTYQTDVLRLQDKLDLIVDGVGNIGLEAGRRLEEHEIWQENQMVLQDRTERQILQLKEKMNVLLMASEGPEEQRTIKQMTENQKKIIDELVFFQAKDAENEKRLKQLEEKLEQQQEQKTAHEWQNKIEIALSVGISTYKTQKKNNLSKERVAHCEKLTGISLEKDVTKQLNALALYFEHSTSPLREQSLDVLIFKALQNAMRSLVPVIPKELTIFSNQEFSFYTSSKIHQNRKEAIQDFIGVLITEWKKDQIITPCTSSHSI